MPKPVQVAIYVDADCWLGSVHLIAELLAVAGTLQRGSAELRNPAMFRVALVGARRTRVLGFTGAAVKPGETLRTCPAPDVVIIPSFYLSSPARTKIAPALRTWLAEADSRGALFVALTSGVRVLAEAGLLDGRDVAVNPADLTAMRNHHPEVHCMPEAPLVVDGRFITASSINPAIDACGYLVSHFFGEKAARKFARYTNSVSQPTYEHAALAAAPWRQHADDRIRQAQTYIERQYLQDLKVEDVAQRAAMSVRNFGRRFEAAVGLTPARYIARCRIEHARQLLEHSKAPILTVAMQSGFNDENAFRRTFRQLVGMTPTAFRATSGSRGYRP